MQIRYIAISIVMFVAFVPFMLLVNHLMEPLVLWSRQIMPTLAAFTSSGFAIAATVLFFLASHALAPILATPLYFLVIVPLRANYVAAYGRCPACGYDIVNIAPDPDGCTVCPECGGAWRCRDLG